MSALLRKILLSALKARLDDAAAKANWNSLSPQQRGFCNHLATRYGWHPGAELPQLEEAERKEMTRLALEYLAWMESRN